MNGTFLWQRERVRGFLETGISDYPRKFTQKRCKRMEHTAKSAKARSGEMPLKSGEFCALVWIRRLATMDEGMISEWLTGFVIMDASRLSSS